MRTYVHRKIICKLIFFSVAVKKYFYVFFEDKNGFLILNVL